MPTQWGTVTSNQIASALSMVKGSSSQYPLLLSFVTPYFQQLCCTVALLMQPCSFSHLTFLPPARGIKPPCVCIETSYHPVCSCIYSLVLTFYKPSIDPRPSLITWADPKKNLSIRGCQSRVSRRDPRRSGDTCNSQTGAGRRKLSLTPI